MRRKAYGFKVAGQTNQGSARLAILGREYVTTKRLVNRDVDRAKSKDAIASMREAIASCDGVKVTRLDYAPPRRNGSMVKASAMPMNFYRGSGYGG